MDILDILLDILLKPPQPLMGLFLKFLLLRPGHWCQFSCWRFCYCLVLCLSTFCSVLGCLNITWKNFEFGITWHVHLNLPKSTAKVRKKTKRTRWQRHLSPVYTGLNIVYHLHGHESSLIIIPKCSVNREHSKACPIEKHWNRTYRLFYIDVIYWIQVESCKMTSRVEFRKYRSSAHMPICNNNRRTYCYRPVIWRHFYHHFRFAQ